jgi:anaerobic magnesium-protoporphyrin IX monomethyl ester cyclase
MTRKRIVLIKPLSGIYDSVYKTIPISLLSISKNIDQNEYEIIIIDQNMSDWKKKLEESFSKEVIAAGLTSTTGHQIYFAKLISQYIKKNSPDTKIIWGGIHATTMPEQTLRENFIDIIMIGEGEKTFSKLIEFISKKKDLAKLKGIGYKDDSKNMYFTMKNELHEVSDLGNLPYNLIEINKYLDNIGDHEFFLEGARGCVYNCTFCYNPCFNEQKWRSDSAQNLVNNIKILNQKYNIKNFFIIDDSFFISEKRVFDFIELIKKNNLKIKWSCEGNLSSLSKYSKESLLELEKSGLRWISIGIEHGSKKIRRYLKKNININDLIKFNKSIAGTKIKARYNFIIGSPIEKEKDLRKSISLVNRLIKDNPNSMIQPFYITVPFPGTEYLKDVKKHGFVVPKKLEDWEDFDPFSIAEKLPWLNKKERRRIKMIMYSSFFIDKKLSYHLNENLLGNIIKFLTEIYRPIAKFRFNHLCDFFYIEGFIFQQINKIQMKLIKKKMSV